MVKFVAILELGVCQGFCQAKDRHHRTVEGVNMVFLTSSKLIKLQFVRHFWRTLWTRLGSKLQFNSSHHSQTDGQTGVVNQRSGNLLRSLIGDNAKQWDLILPQAEFTYNRSVNRTTGKSPFEVVYGRNPITPLDLLHVPEVGQFSKEGADQSEQIKELHRSGDLVLIHLCKEHFLAGRFGKLKPQGDGPFRVLKKINDNEYKIKLHGHYNVSATFNVADLLPYKGDSDDEPNSGSSLFQEGKDDAYAVNERVNDKEEEYPFVNKYPSFQEECIVLVEEESCLVYDIDSEEEESMPFYDTDIEDVIEEEEGFVRKRGFGREEDNIEDVVVVTNDLCLSESEAGSLHLQKPRSAAGRSVSTGESRLFCSLDTLGRYQGGS
ncbi:RNA-directed DNA polymerase [Tanacetum coccineum]